MSFKYTTFGESNQPDVVTPRFHPVNLLGIPAVCRRHDESARFTAHETFIIAGKELLERFFLCFGYLVELVFPICVRHVGAVTALNRLTHCKKSHKWLYDNIHRITFSSISGLHMNTAVEQ